MTDALSQLMEAVLALSEQVSPEKLELLAARIRKLDNKPSGRTAALTVEWLSTPNARQLFDEVLQQWQEAEVSPEELAGIILGASYAYNVAKNEVAVELIWTGPTTPIVSTRHTEQALLEVIDSAKNSLFLTSFVAYKVPSIVEAMENAIQRKVAVTLLLESSDKHGGTVSIDAIGKFRQLLPEVAVYNWADKNDEFEGGKVHAKVAVADQVKCFISSANLTDHAMEKNMEAGVIIEGGAVPKALHMHLEAMVITNIIECLK